MSTKATLQFTATLLLLWGIFGYLFPNVGGTRFTSIEIWFALVSSMALFVTASAPIHIQRWGILIGGLLFLALGLFSMALQNPTDFVIPKTRIEPHLDTSDAVIYGLVFLICAWSWLQSNPTRRKSR
jgi:hypothetical protein